MSVGSWFRNIGRKVSGGINKFGRKVGKFGKGVGRGMGMVFGGVGNAIKSGIDLVEKIPVVGGLITQNPIGRALKLAGTGLRGSSKLLKGDLEGAFDEVKGGLKRVALGRIGKYGKIGKLAKTVLKNA
jgi:hypothetical protein